MTSKWNVFSMKDAYQGRPPIKHAVAGLFEIPSVNIIYGAPSTLKSMFLLDMCACVVKGIPWLQDEDGIATKTTTKQGVLWVDFDNGVRRTHDRVQAVCGHYGLTEESSFYYVSMPTGGLNMAYQASIKNLEDAISSRGVGLVVIDNLGCVIGNTDENSHAMAMIMSNFRLLAERLQVAFVIIHHQRKSNGRQGRAGDALRGHSSIEAALDLALLVERKEQSNRVIIKSTKSRGSHVIPFGACFHFKGDNNTMSEGWFSGVDTDGVERPIERSILNLLEAGEKNQTNLIDHCKVTTKAGRPKIEQAIDYLLKSEKIVRRKGNKSNAIIYALKQPVKVGRQKRKGFKSGRPGIAVSAG